MGRVPVSNGCQSDSLGNRSEQDQKEAQRSKLAAVCPLERPTRSDNWFSGERGIVFTMASVPAQTNDAENMHFLLQNLMSSDNNTRIRAELTFKHLLEANPDAFLFSLIQIALNDTLELSVRQASLLHLKRIVPLYWSPAFDNYKGPNTVNQEVKKTLRESLLKLLGDPDSKIRSSSGYAIVQIAAVDYPDEWPNLLDHLYNATTSPQYSIYEIIGSLCVLQEIFDDVVTDEQFFENGVAVQVLKTCEMLLENANYNLEIKVETLRLLQVICDSLVDVDFEVPNRESFCEAVVPQIYQLLLGLSKNVSNEGGHYVSQLIAWDFKHQIYTILDHLMNSYSELLDKFVTDTLELVLLDLSFERTIYTQLLAIEPTMDAFKSVFIDLDHFYASQRERKEPFQVLTMTIAKKIELAQTLIELHSLKNVEKISKICDLLLPLSTLSASKIDDYNSDFNQFVTDESGLDGQITVRDSVRELLSDMNAKDNSIFIELLIQKFGTIQGSNTDRLIVEALVFLLACCFDNDDTIVSPPPFDVSHFLNNVVDLATDNSLLTEEFQFLVARLILMIPKFIFKYATICKPFGIPSFERITSIIPNLGGADDYLIVKSAILISLQYYNYFIRAREFSIDIQHQLLALIDQLREDSEEDTNMMLLEVMSIIICIDNKSLSQNADSIRLILSIGFKNDSNFALNTSLFECIEDLIKDIPQTSYSTMISSVFPLLISKISEFDGEYNSQIDLSLQVITVFLKDQSNHEIALEVFQSTFAVLTKFIFACDDDALLQSGSECLIELVKNSVSLCSTYIDSETHETGVQILLKSVSKLLSPSMSDRAIVKLGDLVTVLLEHFSDSIHEYLEDILKALTIRLTRAKEVPTIENMILIFNMLTVSQPQATINFLNSFTVESQPALSKVLPIWFQAYEVMRGYNSILSNARAFMEIFKLNNEVVQHLTVDGDAIQSDIPEGLIITRSMAKKMPVKYEQIPADAKIIKLLIDELKNEVAAGKNMENMLKHRHVDVHGLEHHHEHHEDTHEFGEAEDDDDWEDLEGGGEPTFAQLKSYIDEDGTAKRGSDGTDHDLRQLLIQFFKECTTKNISNFEHIYNTYLSESQKAFLSENLAFT